MSEPAESTDNQPKAPIISTHNLSWIAMVVMVAMCLATLIYAASLNIE